MTTSKIGHATIKEVTSRDVANADYGGFLALELQELRKNAPKRPVNTEQPESTKRALKLQAERHPSEDAAWLTRPLPPCLANPEAKSLDELVAFRVLDPSQVVMVEDMRRRGHGNTLGESKASSVTPETRDRGIQAFTYSHPYVPTDKELGRIKKLTEMENVTYPDIKEQKTKDSLPVNTFEKLLAPIGAVCRHGLNLVFAPFKALDDWMFK